MSKAKEYNLMAENGGHDAVNAGMGSLVRYGYVSDQDGSLSIVHCRNTACHAGLDSGSVYDHTPVRVFSTIWPDKALPVPDQYAYLDWLLNRSPYRNVFVSKSAHLALDRGFIVAKGDSNASHMVGGLVASRRLWEYIGIVGLWARLVEVGVQENLAFFLASIGNHKNTLDWGSIEYTEGEGGHRSISPSVMQWGGLKNWCLGKAPRKGQTYKVRKSYYGYHKQWADELAGCKGRPLDSVCKHTSAMMRGYAIRKGVVTVSQLPVATKYNMPFPLQTYHRVGRWSSKPTKDSVPITDFLHYTLDVIVPEINKEIGL